MFLHWRVDTQITLNATCIVIADIAFYHVNQFLLGGESLAVVALPLQNAPETLHGTVINAVRYTGHALRHPCFHKFVVKGSVRVLEASVAVKQRMCAWICPYRLIEGFIYQRIVITVTNDIGNNAAVIEVKNGAEIDLMYRDPLVPFEFRHIGEPLFVGLFCTELAVQQIFGQILRILGSPGAVVVAVFDGGLDASGPTDAKDALVIDLDSVVMTQLIIDSAVSLVWAVHVDMLHLFGNLLVFSDSLALLAGGPTVVCRP